MSETVEIVEQGWFSRLGSSIKGILVAICMIPLAIILLGWNEYRAVERTRALEDTQGAAVHVEINSIDTNNNGKPVHFSGLAETQEELVDDEFEEIKVKNSLALIREVEYYQWTQHEHTRTEKRGTKQVKTTTYTYSKQWSSSPVNSSSFKESAGHENFVRLQIPGNTQYVKMANIGAFTLSDRIISSIGSKSRIPLKEIRRKHRDDLAESFNNYICFAKDKTSPSIGDVRVSFYEKPCVEASVLARQNEDGTLGEYETKHGSVLLISDGVKTAEEMFQTAHNENTMLTWFLRFFGILILYSAIYGLFKPLAVLTDIIPIFGKIIDSGLSFISAMLAFALGSLVIGIAWIVVRPLLGITLLAITGYCAFLIFTRLRKTSKTWIGADKVAAASAKVDEYVSPHAGNAEFINPHASSSNDSGYEDIKL